MKILTFTLLLLLSSLLFAQAQSEASVDTITYDADSVDKAPQFKGGIKGLKRYIKKYVKYPHAASVHDIDGDVFIDMLIDETGEIDIISTRGYHVLAEEAMKAVSSMPKWQPAKRGGDAVRCIIRLVVHFNKYDYSVDVDIIALSDMNEEASELPCYYDENSVDENEDIKIIISIADVEGGEGGIVTVGPVPEPPRVFTIIEQMPEFPGGNEKLNAFIKENMRYPVDAVRAGIQGRVTIRFVVEATGEITNIEVIRKINPSLDSEAIRIIEAMPKWIPGRQCGKEVPVYFNLPIVFRFTGY